MLNYPIFDAMNTLVAPSLLASDFANLQSEIEMINASQGDWIHFDVMDGSFVPNISFGIPVLQAIRKHTNKPIDVHLMINKPENYFEPFKNAGADHICFHWEASSHIHRHLQAIHDLDCKAGLALNPHTRVEEIEEVLEMVDIVNLMSVNPGFGGQKFIPGTLKKIKTLRQMIEKKGLQTHIEIDGGVNMSNASAIVEAGADVLVAGNFVFSSDNPVDTIKKLKDVKP